MLIQAGHVDARSYTLAQIKRFGREVEQAEAARRIAIVHDVRAAMSSDEKSVTKHLRALNKKAGGG